MNTDNEERCTIEFKGSLIILNFEMKPETEFTKPNAIVRTRHFSVMNGVVRVFYNTYYIYCKRYPDFALDVFFQEFPCEPVWSWEND